MDHSTSSRGPHRHRRWSLSAPAATFARDVHRNRVIRHLSPGHSGSRHRRPCRASVIQKGRRLGDRGALDRGHRVRRRSLRGDGTGALGRGRRAGRPARPLGRGDAGHSLVGRATAGRACAVADARARSRRDRVGVHHRAERRRPNARVAAARPSHSVRVGRAARRRGARAGVPPRAHRLRLHSRGRALPAHARHPPSRAASRGTDARRPRVGAAAGAHAAVTASLPVQRAQRARRADRHRAQPRGLRGRRTSRRAATCAPRDRPARGGVAPRGARAGRGVRGDRAGAAG